MLMTKCELQSFPCVNVDYSIFDKTCIDELRLPLSADEIVNQSSFCTIIPISPNFMLCGLETSDYLKALKGKMGLYNLWVDYDDCDDHEKYTMKCIYVGKGFSEQRIKSHINRKFKKSDALYVSFFECGNRFAKYLEQLFLDCYQFDLNKAENSGSEPLYAVWDDFRHNCGTQLHNIANMHEKHIKAESKVKLSALANPTSLRS